MNCINCQAETNNPKFCCKSCSATWTNKNYPKRTKQKRCKCCDSFIYSQRTYCKDCLGNRSIDWQSLTLAEVRGQGNANAGGRYPYIRALSRKKYLASDKPQCCIVCGYDLHFDVAHIKDVKNFTPETLITEVNHLDNLIALCKNHHWEFDNHHLKISSYL